MALQLPGNKAIAAKTERKSAVDSKSKCKI